MCCTGVPFTTSGSAQHKGQQVFGSLQRFEPRARVSAEDLGSALFGSEQVHRLGVLDIRLLNLDRHLGNILVVDDGPSVDSDRYQLVPIDHGFVLPECSDLSDVYFG
jgi:hypothetical protein